MQAGYSNGWPIVNCTSFEILSRSNSQLACLYVATHVYRILFDFVYYYIILGNVYFEVPGSKKNSSIALPVCKQQQQQLRYQGTQHSFEYDRVVLVLSLIHI